MKYFIGLLLIVMSSVASLAEVVRVDIYGGGTLISSYGFADLSSYSGWDDQLLYVSPSNDSTHRQINVNVDEWNYATTSSCDASYLYAFAVAPSGYHIEVFSDTSGDTGNIYENSNLAYAECSYWYRVLPD